MVRATELPVALILPGVGSLKDGVGGVLDNFENLAVAVAAGEHGLFDIEVLSDEFWLDLVNRERFVTIRGDRPGEC
jgi:hypothetical protein